MNGTTGSPGRTAVLCAGLLAAAVGLFLVINSWGEALPAPEGEGVSRPAGARVDVLPHVLLSLAAVLLVGRVLGRLFVYLGQPPVIGEVVAGICLGPSLLGRLSPEAMAFLLPPSVAPSLGVLAQIGVVLYMFLVGLELNPARLGGRAHSVIAVSQAGIVVPFVLGSALALGLYSRLAPAGVPFTSFALFMGVSLSVTAFPVLARILSDRGMTRTDLGVFALGCAAAGDVAAWCLLAFVVGVAQAAVGGALLVAALSLAYIALVFTAVRPLAARFAGRIREEQVGPGVVAGVLLALLLSALATEAIGIHAVFGAFLLGAVVPHDSALARELTRKFEDLVTVLLLPAFFAFTGLRTEIGLVSGWEGWLACGLITLVATVGKFGGTAAAARLTGLDWHTAASLGVLMNTRGLMELIVLNIGLDLGVISPALFAMMVLMALATTLGTTPALHLLQKGAATPAPCATAGTKDPLPSAPGSIPS
jgi:Kef-type K+ transport system membrane component KefB